MAAKTIKEAVDLLYYWQYGSNPTNFASMIYTLMGKADHENYDRLKLAFPLEVDVYEQWHSSMNGDEFFREWGFINV